MLLDNVSFSASPNEMSAIFGVSGGGKTTLLDILAGRKPVGSVSGTILFNGNPRGKSVNYSSAYDMQSCLLHAELTVRETLTFAARLRLDGSRFRTEVARAERVDLMMKLLRLEERADTVVGSEQQRGLSGGEVRRLSIGTDIIFFPSLIYLDEPTTGKSVVVVYILVV